MLRFLGAVLRFRLDSLDFWVESLDFCVDCLDACVDCLDSCNDCLDLCVERLDSCAECLDSCNERLDFCVDCLDPRREIYAEEYIVAKSPVGEYIVATVYLRRNFTTRHEGEITSDSDTWRPRLQRALRAGQARLPQVICRWRRRCPCPLPQPVSQRHSIIRLRAHSRPFWQVWRRTAPWRRSATCALKVAGCACSPCAH